jgi:molecular chaperone DnaK
MPVCSLSWRKEDDPVGLSIGIDLGTTNTVGAVMEGTRARIIQISGHENLLRSAVYMPEKGDPSVGSKAYDRAGAEPEHVAISIKRLMGRQFDDEHVQKVRQRYQYRVEKNPEGSDVVVPLRGKNYTPTDISAMILSHVKKQAEQRLGQQVTHAVITVPAYFDPIQKEQTRIAGEQAGFRVKKILDEPTAAAVAYGLDECGDEPKTVLVYDLGGGTFDISALLITNGYYDQLDIEGDMWLGGDDFDQQIMDYCVQEIKNKHGVDPTSDRKFMFRLRAYAESAKKELGEIDQTEIDLTGVGLRGPSGEMIEGFIPITRTLFEQMISEQVQTTVGLMDTALKEADLAPEQVDSVLLVGGSTAVPIVRRALVQRFGEEKICQRMDAMACVAVGAAKIARDLAGIVCPKCGHMNPVDATACEVCQFELRPEKPCTECGHTNPLDAEQCASCGAPFKEIDIGGKTPQAIGIEVEGGRYEIIMPKNFPFPSVVPCERRFRTARAAQMVIYVPVFQGEMSGDAHRNQFLGAGDIQLSTQVPRGTPVEVSISMDRDGVLSGSAIVRVGESPIVHTFSIDPRYGDKVMPVIDRDDDDEDIGGGAGGSSRADAHPPWKGELIYHLVLGQTLLNRFAWFMGDDMVKEMRAMVEAAEAADDANDEGKATEANARFRTWFESHSAYSLLAYADAISRNSELDPEIAGAIGDKINTIAKMVSDGHGDAIGDHLSALDRLVGRANADLEKKMGGSTGPHEKVYKGTYLE